MRTDKARTVQISPPSFLTTVLSDLLKSKFESVSVWVMTNFELRCLWFATFRPCQCMYVLSNCTRLATRDKLLKPQLANRARAEMKWNNAVYECPKQTLTERGIVHPRLHTFNGDGSCDNNNHTLCMPLMCTMLVFNEFQSLTVKIMKQLCLAFFILQLITGNWIISDLPFICNPKNIEDSDHY